MPTSWCDTRIDELKAEIEHLRTELVVAAVDVERLKADRAELLALSTELYEALDACITWLSSGFAPQSQALALEQADKARSHYRAAIAIESLRADKAELHAEIKRLRAELEKANEPVWPVIQAVRPQGT